jgi:NADH:ubiquinone reductase (H+-translocating)
MSHDEGMARLRVVIVGGGFGGLWCAQALAKAPLDVVLVDRTNHHLFQPLLYQVATAGLSPSDIAQPIRGILSRQKNLQVLMQEVVGMEEKSLVFADGQRLSFDIAVLATGASHSYFGRPEWEGLAPGLKTLEDATKIRRRVLAAFERAEASSCIEDARRELSFVVVGGGPTGVELAGSIAELAKKVLKQEFDRIKTEQARVVLVEAGPAILSSFGPELSARASSDLRDLGVDVQTGTMVKEIDPDGVDTSRGRIDARTVIWAAGVQASPAAAWLQVPAGPGGRVLVGGFFQPEGKEDVYVIGDAAAFKMEDGSWLPGVSPAAMQAGAYVAKRIVSSLAGRQVEPFRYWDKGSMATIGRRKAVAKLGNLKMTGSVGWVAWLALHIWFLIGFRNKLIVLVQWLAAYLFNRPGVRLITGADRPGEGPPR